MTTPKTQHVLSFFFFHPPTCTHPPVNMSAAKRLQQHAQLKENKEPLKTLHDELMKEHKKVLVQM